MKVRSMEVWEYAVPFRGFTDQRVSPLDTRRGFLLKAITEEGLSGWGEAAPWPGTSPEKLSDVRHHLSPLLVTAPGLAIADDKEGLSRQLVALAREYQWPPSLRFAVETMFTGLAAQRAGVPLAVWYNPEAASGVPLSALIIGTGESFTARISRKLRRGYTTFKLKVGSEKIDDDIQRVHHLREVSGDKAMVRLDANRRFSFSQAVGFLNEVRACNIQFIEEPLKRSDLHSLPTLSETGQVSIALDETVAEQKVLQAYLDSGAVSAVVLKPTVLGGIDSCLEIAGLCTACGAKVAVTSTLETGIGVTACLQLAAILGDRSLACGLDTLELLKDTLIGKGPVVERGAMMLPDCPGLGVEHAAPQMAEVWEPQL